jgi:hypothetical protein
MDGKVRREYRKCRSEMQTRMQEHFKEQFKQANSAGNGTLSRAEIEQTMPMLAHNFDEIDTNEDGRYHSRNLRSTAKKWKKLPSDVMRARPTLASAIRKCLTT